MTDQNRVSVPVDRDQAKIFFSKVNCNSILRYAFRTTRPRLDLVVRRSLSGDIEVKSTESRRARGVRLPDQNAVALERLSRCDDFTGPDDHVLCSRLGRRLDPSALRRRYERARDAAGLEPLRFHDLRHTHGSLLVAVHRILRVVALNAIGIHDPLTSAGLFWERWSVVALCGRAIPRLGPAAPILAWHLDSNTVRADSDRVASALRCLFVTATETTAPR